MSKSWNLNDMPSQAGKRFLITGANSGIGFWTAVELARHGAVVVMACRDEARGRESLQRLRVEAKGNGSAAGEAELVLLNLASLDSVRRVAEAELERRDEYAQAQRDGGWI
jgi:NAD(P)-dependent dehydrogenase (short-subunit alcohol dehydrogenase family)